MKSKETWNLFQKNLDHEDKRTSGMMFAETSTSGTSASRVAFRSSLTDILGKGCVLEEEGDEEEYEDEDNGNEDKDDD